MSKKRMFRVIWAWQEEKEEKWLEDMAEKGWFFESYVPFIYTFVSREPGKHIYKFDYKSISNKDIQEYIQIFQDAGWEYVTRFSNWHYFRRVDDGIASPDIFSDKESKIRKYKDLFNFIGIFFMMNLFNVLNNVFSHGIDDPRPTLTILRGIMVLTTSLLGYGIFKIWRKIEKLKG